MCSPLFFLKFLYFKTFLHWRRKTCICTDLGSLQTPTILECTYNVQTCFGLWWSKVIQRSPRAMTMGYPETPGHANDNLLLKQFSFSALDWIFTPSGFIDCLWCNLQTPRRATESITAPLKKWTKRPQVGVGGLNSHLYVHVLDIKGLISPKNHIVWLLFDWRAYGKYSYILLFVSGNDT
jgi:hypothetical protein